MIGGDGVKNTVLNARPKQLVVFFRAQRRTHNVFQRFINRQIVTGIVQEKILRARFRIHIFLIALPGLLHIRQPQPIGQVDNIEGGIPRHVRKKQHAVNGLRFALQRAAFGVVVRGRQSLF